MQRQLRERITDLISLPTIPSPTLPRSVGGFFHPSIGTAELEMLSHLRAVRANCLVTPRNKAGPGARRVSFYPFPTYLAPQNTGLHNHIIGHSRRRFGELPGGWRPITVSIRLTPSLEVFPQQKLKTRCSKLGNLIFLVDIEAASCRSNGRSFAPQNTSATEGRDRGKSKRGPKTRSVQPRPTPTASSPIRARNPFMPLAPWPPRQKADKLPALQPRPRYTRGHFPATSRPSIFPYSNPVPGVGTVVSSESAAWLRTK
jgi:hypothetical protein